MINRLGCCSRWHPLEHHSGQALTAFDVYCTEYDSGVGIAGFDVEYQVDGQA
jgi:hypothetical protein